MPKKNKADQPVEENKIRAVWNEKEEEWYFSIVDFIKAVIDSPNPHNYWKALKRRLNQEDCRVMASCQQLKMQSADGKFHKTDMANTEQLLRIIQSTSSPKAELFKRWLAIVGKERVDETIALELTIDRALAAYFKKGYSAEWINQRLQGVQGVKGLSVRSKKQGLEYAILTNEIRRAWMSAGRYKKCKGPKKGPQRSDAGSLELLFNLLSEATAPELSEKRKPVPFEDIRQIMRKEYSNAKKENIETTDDGRVITQKNIVGFTKVLGTIIDDVDKADKDKKEKEKGK
ncbi:phage antirepressor [Candidatus Termititenax aidoneus]|uniref:Phage antirepressor n=1 Tax=Termititenax aidoneus TaxID=2218524 RepID=A0A388TD85_TERA1|nr:phage antirepressor [Candidatus Termititenax aidoneus]